MTSEIRFGTDGWRAIIARDFTFANVARCSQGLVDYLKERGTADRGLVVGYDTRFLSREFAETVASVCAGNGVRAYLARESAPTPVVSLSVLTQQAAGAAIITASHNPGTWNGFKFKPEYAGSATDEITGRLENKIDAVSEPLTIPLSEGIERGLIVEFDPRPGYVERVGSLVDLSLIRGFGIPRHGGRHVRRRRRLYRRTVEWRSFNRHRAERLSQPRFSRNGAARTHRS